MVKIEAEIEVERSVEDVFRFVAVEHCANHPRWDPSVSSITHDKGALGIGSILEISRRTMGRDETLPFTVTEWEAPSRMAIRTASADLELTLASTFTAIGPQRTRLTLGADARAHGLRALLIPLMRKKFGSDIRANLRRLKQLIESEGVAGVAAGSLVSEVGA